MVERWNYFAFSGITSVVIGNFVWVCSFQHAQKPLTVCSLNVASNSNNCFFYKNVLLNETYYAMYKGILNIVNYFFTSSFITINSIR